MFALMMLSTLALLALALGVVAWQTHTWRRLALGAFDANRVMQSDVMRQDRELVRLTLELQRARLRHRALWDATQPPPAPVVPLVPSIVSPGPPSRPSDVPPQIPEPLAAGPAVPQLGRVTSPFDAGKTQAGFLAPEGALGRGVRVPPFEPSPGPQVAL